MQSISHISRRSSLWLALAALSIVFAVGCAGSGAGNKEDAERLEFLSGLPRLEYNKGGVAFSVAEIKEFKAVHRDSVGWASMLQETDGNGQIVYFFIRGYGQELADPQVRVEYIAKDLPNCGSEEELMNWLKSAYINEERNGQVISDGSKVSTLGGQDVEILEIHTPPVQVNDSLTRSEKTMAWAYLDEGSRFVGFSYSAVEQAAYDEGLPLFKDLIRSYKSN